MEADEIAIIEFVNNKLDDFILFDVGAAEGAYTDCVRSHCGTVTAHLFEPRSNAAQLLRDKYRNPDLTIINNAAVGNVIEKTQLTLGTDDICQSHLRGVFEGEQWEEVQVITIDSYIYDYLYIDDPIFLKIDTEGYEVPVLQGAQGAFADSKIQAVQFEYGGTWGPDSPWSRTLEDAMRWIPTSFTLYEFRDGELYPVKTLTDDYCYRNYLAI